MLTRMASWDTDVPGPSGSMTEGEASTTQINGLYVPQVKQSKKKKGVPQFLPAQDIEVAKSGCSYAPSPAPSRTKLILPSGKTLFPPIPENNNCQPQAVQPDTKAKQEINRSATLVRVVIRRNGDTPKSTVIRREEMNSSTSKSTLIFDWAPRGPYVPAVKKAREQIAELKSDSPARGMKKFGVVKLNNAKGGKVVVKSRQKAPLKNVFPGVLKNRGMVPIEDVKVESDLLADSVEIDGSGYDMLVLTVPERTRSSPNVLENCALVCAEDVKKEIESPTDSDEADSSACTSTIHIHTAPHEQTDCNVPSSNLLENCGIDLVGDVKKEVESPTDSVEEEGSCSTSTMPTQAVPHRHTDCKKENVKTEVASLTDFADIDGLRSSPVQKVPREHSDCEVCGVVMTTSLMRKLHELHNNRMCWVCLHCAHSDKTEVEAVQHFYDTHIQAARLANTGQEFQPVVYDLQCPLPICRKGSFTHISAWKSHVLSHCDVFKHSSRYCSRRFSTTQTRLSHEQEHQVFSAKNNAIEGECCPLCGVCNQWSLESETGYSMSHMAVHGLRKYTMCRCCFAFWEDDLDNHQMWTHFLNNHCTVQLPLTRTPSNTWVTCNICGITDRQYLINKHMVREHLVQGYKARKGAKGCLKIQVDANTKLFLGLPIYRVLKKKRPHGD